MMHVLELIPPIQALGLGISRVGDGEVEVVQELKLPIPCPDEKGYRDYDRGAANSSGKRIPSRHRVSRHGRSPKNSSASIH